MALKLIFFALFFNTKLFAQPVNYQSLFTNATFSKTIDQSKPIGAIEGHADVTLTGGATYTIPIKVPPGTNGIEPKISIQYNSQSNNGIAGWGWNISGMSAIVRTPKSNFLDDEVQPVTYTSADVFSLDGNRLYANNGLYGANGTTYDKEQIDFATITSFGNIGNGPQYFTVKDRLGTTYEYGNSSDAKVLTDNGNEVMMWRLNRVIDVHGNYMEYQYLFNGRESLLYKIFYTGNVALGFGPYNELQFDYFSGRVDHNTMYEGGASLDSKSILKSITIRGEANQPFKKYAFEYGNDDLYSYLQEVREFGSDNFLSELNSTIFKYGEQPVDFIKSEISLSSTINTDDEILTGNFTGVGKSDIIKLEHGLVNNVDKILNIGLYVKNIAGGYFQQGNIVPPINHFSIKSKKDISINPFYASRSAFDYNGDNKDDLIFIEGNDVLLANSPEAAYEITNLKLVFSNNGLLSSSNFILPSAPYNRFYESTNPSIVSDFDGDGSTDYILLPSAIFHGYYPWNGGQLIWVHSTKPHFYSKSVLDAPLEIHNLHIPNSPLNPGYPEISDIITPQNLKDKFIPLDFDGDGSSELLVLKNTWMYIYKFTRNVQGNHIEASLIYQSQLINNEYYVNVGDFNGDGKTDLFTGFDSFIPNAPYVWQVYLSTGNGFVQSTTPQLGWPVFATFATQQNNITVADNYIVADFNGDGKSDILKGKKGLCFIGSNYDLDIYYSKGLSFEHKNFSFPSDVICGNGQNITFVNNPFQVADINGDGRNDLIYKSSITSNLLGVLKFKDFGKERLLQKIIDGNNNIIEFRIDPITIDGNLFTRGNTAFSFQAPINVVSSLTSTNGIGGYHSVNYNYEDARIEHFGRGFIGFAVLKKSDPTQNLFTRETFFSTYFRSLLYLKTAETYQLNTNTLISTLTYSNSYVSYGGKLFRQRNDDEVSHNVLQGYTQKIFNISFDFWGNVLVKRSEIYKTANSNIEESTTSFQYIVPGNASNIPTVPSQIDVVQLRAGAPSVSTQNTYEYFANGKLKKNIQFSNTANPVTTSYSYNIAGLVKIKDISVANLPSRRELFGYDSKYRFITNKTQTSLPAFFATNFFEYFVSDPLFGNPLSIISANCQTQTFSYDPFGRLITTNHKVGTPDAYSVSYSRGWNINGLINTFETIAHPGKPDITTYFDKLGRKRMTVIKGFGNQDVSVTNTYDARGNLATESNSFLAAEVPIITTYTYDNWNRLESSSNALETINNSYTFINGDLKITTINTATNQTNSKLFDPTGKVISATDDGGTISFNYDSWGNEIKVKKGAQTFTQKTYDDFNRLVSSTDVNGGTKTYMYNALGELTQETDALGNTHSYVYDAAGRLKEKNGVEGIITYTYGNGVDLCKNGYLTQVSNFNGVEESYDYDLYGRIVEKSTIVDANTYLHKYTYDQYDNNLSIQYPSGFKTYNEFTSDGYLSKVGYATAFNGQGQPTAFNYFYTANSFNGMGQAKSYLLGNGYTTTKNYQYGYLLKHEAKLGNTTLHNLEYTYNYANGNMVSRKDNFPIVPQTEVFTYDNLDRLSSSQVSIPNFTFDAVNYNYDGGNNYSKGNLTHNSIVGNFTYNGSKYHQLGFAQGIVNMPPGQVYIGPTIIPNTDVISDLQQQITYTPFQKTDKINEDNREIQFIYDANYDRIKSVFTDLNTNETTTKYFLGDFETRTNPQGETYSIHYIKGGDGLCAMVTMDDNAGTDIHYVYTDHLGSICKVTDASGNMEAWQSFDAWGRQRNPNDWAQIYPSLQANINVPEWLYRGYTGHEHLPEFALINMNGRMYDPALGRMCSPDKYIADPYSTQAYNRYTYANNNPLKYTDPSGDVINLIAGAIGAGVGGLINLGVMAYRGKVTNFGTGLAAFGIGAVAGFVGGITCGASLAATGLTTGIMAGTVSGAVSGAVSAPILTFGNGVVFHDFDPNKSIGRQLVESSLIGGISGAVIGGTIGFIQAKWFIPKPRVNVEMDEIKPGKYKIGPEYNIGPDGSGPNLKIKFDGNAALKAINQNRSINAHVNITNEEAMQNIVKYAEMTGKDYQLQNIIKDNGMRMTRLTIDNTIYQFRSFSTNNLPTMDVFLKTVQKEAIWKIRTIE